MKKYLIFVLLIMLSSSSLAQEKQTTEQQEQQAEKFSIQLHNMMCDVYNTSKIPSYNIVWQKLNVGISKSEYIWNNITLSDLAVVFSVDVENETYSISLPNLKCEMDLYGYLSNLNTNKKDDAVNGYIESIYKYLVQKQNEYVAKHKEVK